MEAITQEVNRTLRGWFEYFKDSLQNVFKKEDRWVRGRLRAVLRKRHKGHRRARGLDQPRWPKAACAELGLISLAAAHYEAMQTRKRTH